MFRLDMASHTINSTSGSTFGSKVNSQPRNAPFFLGPDLLRYLPPGPHLCVVVCDHTEAFRSPGPVGLCAELEQHLRAIWTSPGRITSDWAARLAETKPPVGSEGLRHRLIKLFLRL